MNLYEAFPKRENEESDEKKAIEKFKNEKKKKKTTTYCKKITCGVKFVWDIYNCRKKLCLFHFLRVVCAVGLSFF